MSSDASTLPLRKPLLGGARSWGQIQMGEGDRDQEQVQPATLAQTLIGAASLLTIVVCSLLIVIVSADRPTFPPSHTHFFPGWLAGPLGGLWPGFPRGEAVKWVFTCSLLLMYGAYLLGLRYVPMLRTRWAIAAVVGVHFILLLSPPLALTDIFNYVNYARMEVVHHLNPYTTIPIYEPHDDPSFSLSNWHHLLSPYGPLFTLLTFAVVPLGVAASFWAFKIILMLASLGTIFLVYRCARLLGREPVQAIVFAGLNPVVLVWGLGGDHNDFLMIFFAVLGFYLLLRAQQSDFGWFAAAAGAAFVLAVAIKASGAILLPVVLAGLLRTPRRLLQTIAGMAIAGAVVAVLSVSAFGLHLPDLSTQGSLVTAWSPSNLIGLAGGSGGETEGLHHALTFVLVALVGLASVQAWRKSDLITASGWASVALWLTLTWVLPWYVLWALPLAALSRSRWLRTTVLAFGLFFALVWAPLAGNFFDSIGFEPEKTQLGQLHQRYVKELLN
jgi:hypothetical protein